MDPGIIVREGPGRTEKKSPDNVFFFVCFFLFFVVVFFCSPQLILRSQMVIFKEIYHFSWFQRGSNIFQGGVQLFPGGSNCLFPIETHITCDFPGGGPDPLSPPLDPHLSLLLSLGSSSDV